ncbi:uncharacterized protein LOC135956371, partial [Calliphora vicina]|uniref:uncharacterized protein LOC135956371 n=1 Tax=Calliphora vicina TaxID=7373 RepID=UPI00325B5463
FANLRVQLARSPGARSSTLSLNTQNFIPTGLTSPLLPPQQQHLHQQQQQQQQQQLPYRWYSGARRSRSAQYEYHM